MSRFLVTGGAGFIGSHLVDALLDQGKAVTVLDDFSSGKEENLGSALKKDPTIRVVRGDVADPKVAQEAMIEVETVFHQAAIGSVPKSVEDPIGSHAANVTGTVTMLVAAREAGALRFVNAASSSAYGETPELPKRESMTPKPMSPYATTKLAQEHYCHAFACSYGMKTVSLRYFNVYGPRQDPHSHYAAVIPKFFHSFLNEKAPTIFGDGEQTRDFSFVKDVVQANLLASGFSNASGQVFNIAGGNRITINELAGMIAEISGTSLKPLYEPPRVGDIRDSLADISLAKNELGWNPQTALPDGLQHCHKWYRTQV